MKRTLSVSAVAALAIAGAAFASPQEAPADNGFNLMMPVEDAETSDDGWNLGINEDVTEDGYVIPEGVVEDRLGDIAEISTGDTEKPEISTELPKIEAPEDDLIRLN